jgi:hypothetical protein
MKLLNCLKCNSIISLSKIALKCPCGLSKGKYLQNGLTAVIAGECRALGMINPEYIKSLNTPTIPFETYYKWFPILSDPKHNVIKMTVTEFDDQEELLEVNNSKNDNE